jgi:hypothetical protein
VNVGRDARLACRIGDSINMKHADKSDALVPQNRTKWFANEGFANPNASVSAVRQGNISFEAGYNNSEVRYLERPHPPYDPSEPMRYARSWIAFWIIQP